MKNIIGWQIRHIRIAKGLTVHQVSSALPNSSSLSSEELAQVELGTRKIYDHELLAISQVFGVSVEELYATPPGKTLPGDIEAWTLLAQLEDIISGIEAQADNLGIDMDEARSWWQKARRIMDRRNRALSRPSKASVADQKSTPPTKRRPKQEKK